MNEVRGVQTIGIPRGLMYYREGILWRKFFEELGYDCVISPRGDREILEQGMEYAIDESCLPLKMYLGHVRYLLGKCDAIFIPRMGGYKKREKMCTRYEALPDLIHNIFRQEEIRILSFSYDWNDHTDEAEVFEKFGLSLGKTRKQARQAYKQAHKSQEAFLAQRQKKQELLLKKDGLKILMAGHPYVIHDAYMGAPISRILRTLGAQVLYTDDVNRAQAVKRSYQYADTMPWTVNREITGAADLLLEKVDGMVIASAYPCGPDGLVNDMLIRWFHHKPILLVTLDAQSGMAGLETRLESFIDIIQYQKAGGYAKN